MKSKGLGRGLDDLIAQSNIVSKDTTLEAPISPSQLNVSCIAVIRTKAGSGEKHLVRRVRKEYSSQGKQVLTIKVCSDLTTDLKRWVADYGPLVTFDEVKQGNLDGQIVLNWEDKNNLNDFLRAVNHKDVICIFTVGTDSAGGLWRRIRIIGPYCKKVMLSVNFEVANSILPALEVERAILKQEHHLREKLCFGVFYSKRRYSEIPVGSLENEINKAHKSLL